MSVNPDPRPGRWLLPLVVLGMATFTWVFVNEATGVDLSASDPTTTTAPTTAPTTVPGTPTTTLPIDPNDVGVMAYIGQIQLKADELTDLKTEMEAVNAGWDSDPRTVRYADAESRLNALKSDVAAWSSSLNLLAAPEALIPTHQSLITQAGLLVTEAESAYDGLVNSPSAEPRQNAAAAFSNLANEFAAMVQTALATPQ